MWQVKFGQKFKFIAKVQLVFPLCAVRVEQAWD